MNTITSQSHRLRCTITVALDRLMEKPDNGRPHRLVDVSCFPSLRVVEAWSLPVLSSTRYKKGGSFWLTSERKIMSCKGTWLLRRLLLSEVSLNANEHRNTLLLESFIDDIESL